MQDKIPENIMPKKRELGFFVKNILVLGNDGNNGEYKNNINQVIKTHPVIISDGSNDPNRVDRIVEQIIWLAECAQAHWKPYRITRVVTDEFSFYTKNTPLTIDEYKRVINETSKALITLPPNIVLIISSMPVLWPSGSLRNALLHIQSPKDSSAEPIMHHFSKEDYSALDPLYLKSQHLACIKTNCYAFEADNYADLEYSPDVVLKDTKIQCNDKNQYKSAIIVEFNGLHRMIEVVDVCVDHKHGVGMSNAEQLLKTIADPPFYISHIVTANSIDLVANKLTASAVHADWCEHKVEGVQHKVKQDKPQKTIFGSMGFVFHYGEKRADIIYANLLNIAIQKINIPITSVRLHRQNTILHEALLRDKKSHRQRIQHAQRLENILQYFDSNTINQMNQDGDTPLHLAIDDFDNKIIVVKLLKLGAKLTIKNTAGITPIGKAYQTNNMHLIPLLCDTVMTHAISYNVHRDTILELLAEIKKKWIKKQLVYDALLQEIARVNVDVQMILRLLQAVANPVELINNNLSQLMSRLAAHKEIYTYFIRQNIFNQANQVRIDTLAAELRLELVKQALSEMPASAERLTVFLYRLKTLQYSFNPTECEQLLTYEAVLPNGMDNLDPDEQAVVKAYLSNDYKKIEDLSNLKKVNVVKIAEVFSLHVAPQVKTWIQHELIKLDAQTAIIAEFHKGSAADLHLMQRLLSKNIHLNADCGLENGLTIGEQAIVQAFMHSCLKSSTAVTQLQAIIVNTVFSFLKPEQLQGIVNVICKQVQDPQANYSKESIINWIYNAHVMYELGKSSPDFEMILDALSQGKINGNAPAIDYSVKKDVHIIFNIAERLINHAYNRLKINPQLFAQVYAALKKQSITINAEKISKIANVAANPADVAHRINQELINIDARQAITNEFRYGSSADLNTIAMALSKQTICLDIECGLNNNLTIGEQAIAQAFISDSSEQFYKAQVKSILSTEGLRFTQEQIADITESFKTSPNARSAAENHNSNDVRTWLYQVRIQHEFNKATPNNAIILETLSQGAKISNSFSNLLYNKQKEPCIFTIAEESIKHAYQYRHIAPQLFADIYLILQENGICISPEMIRKIASLFHDSQCTTEWINNQLLVLMKEQTKTILHC